MISDQYAAGVFDKVIHLKLRKRKGKYSRKMKTFPEDSCQPKGGGDVTSVIPAIHG